MIEVQALRSILAVRRQELLIGGTVTNRIRVTLEIGPKGKKVVAVAPDWPGLERGAKTGEEAIERLRSYIPRYSHIAKLAQMNAEFDTIIGWPATATACDLLPGNNKSPQE